MNHKIAIEKSQKIFEKLMEINAFTIHEAGVTGLADSFITVEYNFYHEGSPYKYTTSLGDNVVYEKVFNGVSVNNKNIKFRNTQYMRDERSFITKCLND